MQRVSDRRSKNRRSGWPALPSTLLPAFPPRRLYSARRQIQTAEGLEGDQPAVAVPRVTLRPEEAAYAHGASDVTINLDDADCRVRVSVAAHAPNAAAAPTLSAVPTQLSPENADPGQREGRPGQHPSHLTWANWHVTKMWTSAVCERRVASRQQQFR